MILDQVEFGRFAIKICDHVETRIRTTNPRPEHPGESHDKEPHKYYVNLYCLGDSAERYRLMQSIEADSLDKAINIRLAVMVTAKNVLAMVRDFAKE